MRLMLLGTALVLGLSVPAISNDTPVAPTAPQLTAMPSVVDLPEATVDLSDLYVAMPDVPVPPQRPTSFAPRRPAPAKVAQVRGQQDRPAARVPRAPEPVAVAQPAPKTPRIWMTVGNGF